VSFQHQWVLFLEVLPAALLAWVWWRRPARLVLPFDHGPDRRGLAWGALLGLAESLPALLLAVAIALLAGPQRFDEPRDKRALTNIQICLDISGSMEVDWGDGSRYDGAMKAVEDFVKFRKGDAYGLTFFGSEFLHWCPLTTDVSAITCSTPFMRPENVPPWFGGTEIGKALKGCLKEMTKREEGDRTIILISDGQSFDLHGEEGEAIARDLKAHGITLFGIIVGGESAQEELYAIAQTTGGAVWEAGDPVALKEIFQKIDTMKPARMEKALAEAMDHFRPWCVAGLSLLAAMGLAAFGLRAVPW
jgi:Ca-activated chloride channel family protein